MPFVPAANTLEARLRFVLDGQIAENVIYFQGSAGVTPALATTLGGALVTWWNTRFKADSGNLMALLEVYMTDLSFATSFTVSYVTGLPSTGTSASPTLPNNVAMCVTFRTGNRGRSGRGRNYVMGLTETDVTGNTISAGRASNAAAAYTALIGAGTFVAGLQWVVVSRFTGGAPRGAALVQPITTALLVNNVVDSQRRRLPGRGR